MTEDEERSGKQADGLDRRMLLTAGAAVAATTALTAASVAQTGPETALPAATVTQRSPNTVQMLGAIYKDFGYLSHFNQDKYSPSNINDVHDNVRGLNGKQPWFQNRGALKWGLYQQRVEADPNKWGSTPKKGQVAFTNWPDFSQEARVDLEKQPAAFSDPKNAMNPFDTSQVANNFLEHLDEVVRIALWDYAIPMKIYVGSKQGRHHGLATEWQPPPPWTNSPPASAKLSITMSCPEGGWEGYAVWRNPSPSADITKFVATWIVPQNPPGPDGQIIFIFNGLESVSGTDATGKVVTGGILQPVLQYADSGDNAGWYVRSWYLTAAFDPAQYSVLPPPTSSVDQAHLALENRCYSVAVKVSPGQTITGTIVGGKNGTKFNYTCSLDIDNQHQSVTELQLTDIPEPVIAVCAVESYGITTKPNDYPAGAITLSSISLQVQGTSVSPIQWTVNKNNLGLDFKTSHTMNGTKVEFKLA